jgi:gliding motility-associated-like protein
MQKQKCIFTITISLAFFVTPKLNFAQCGISADFTLQPNSACLECNYDGPSILINEVSLEPTIGDGSIFGLNSSGIVGEGEWIELYNPDWCNSVDISGYILGSFNSNGDTFFQPVTSNAMAFSLPQGTVVPPLGFVIVRGSNAPVPPPGVIDIVVNNANNGVCIGGGLPPQSRIWFQNSQGWFAFYDNNGVMQDAISWGVPSPASDYNQSPCIPPNSSLPSGTVLPSYNAGGVGTNLGFPMWGMSFVRIPDGGNWSSMQLPEFNSYGDCNDPNNCLSQTGITTCNGTATINITAGNAPFTYLWNDPASQNNATALNLCAGNYEVIVTDANGCQQTFSTTVVEDLFEVNFTVQQPSCANDDGSIALSIDPPGNYTITWSSNTGITGTSTTTASNLSQGNYTISVDGGGCIKDTTIQLMAPNQIDDVLTSVTPTTCNKSNGAIEINIIGGTAPFSVVVNNESPTSNTSFTDLVAGNYSIAVTDANGCIFSVSDIIVSASEGIASVDLTIFDEDCGDSNGEISVNNISGGASPFSLFLNDQESELGIWSDLSAGTYSLEIIDANDCDWTEIITVEQIGGGKITEIPNIFTPNADGVNDIWRIALDCIESYDCVIINRWGNIVYQSKNYQDGWDGLDTAGMPVTDGVYFYKINYQFIGEPSPKEIHGFIHLKR